MTMIAISHPASPLDDPPVDPAAAAAAAAAQEGVSKAITTTRQLPVIQAFALVHEDMISIPIAHAQHARALLSCGACP